MQYRAYLLTTVSSLAILSVVTAAGAADLPAQRVVKATPAIVEAPPTWTGFYIGVQGGVVWSDASPSGDLDTLLGSSNWTSQQSWTSPLIGGFAGYDYQIGRVVVGVEADLNARLHNRSNSLPSVFGINFTDNWRSEANWDASLRGRLGVLPTKQVLLYVTGGVAFSNFKFSNADVSSESDVYWGTRNIYGGNRIGWTFGGGGQYAITRNWNVRVEFRHTEWGTKSASGTFDFGKGGPGSYRAKISDDRVTGGLAYKF